ncbi:MAG TPA: F0F1 ATP synthase subunit A [Egicoccus sp.]|nr:F0F1 ATP synthase subunit A [Egicoccus sp.]HSK24591.1 F0F1 ATP synthase subunit A [Egicoccus sp.]
MDIAQLTPDQTVLWEAGCVHLTATVVWTWAVMALMIVGGWSITRRLTAGPDPSRWQTGLEAIVSHLRQEISEITGDRDPGRYVPFVGTLFSFIAVSNALTIVPGYIPPTASLSTTAALALTVLVAVPIYGIAESGLGPYLRQYLQPNVLMLPFNVIGEVSRTLALAVRLFGNVMSGVKIVAILIAIVPFFFPLVLSALALLTGLIQAYIFAVLAMVYIASGMRVRAAAPPSTSPSTSESEHG